MQSADVDYGFCPDDSTGEAAHSAGPPLSSVLSLNASELMDRIQELYRSRSTSSPLKRALTEFLSDQTLHSVTQLSRITESAHDGFNLAAAAALTLGTQALHRGDVTIALQAAAIAHQLAPTRPATQILAALVARHGGDRAAERAALRRAHALDPDEPAVALAFGRALADTTQLPEAARALERYLRSVPEDTTAGQLLRRVQLQRQLHRGMRSTRGNGVTLLSPQALLSREEAKSLTQRTHELLDEAGTLTGLPPRTELLVVIYPERSDLIASTCVPNWTDGVFDGVLRLHAKSVQDRPRFERVLRHEVFHAQLASRSIRAPHWFHEGVAQFFAGELGPAHLRSFRFMVTHNTHIPLESMDGSFLVIDSTSDARLAYHQSLAMVQMMVAQGGADAVATAVDYLSSGGAERGLWAHMLGQHASSADLLGHLRKTITAIP